MSKKYGCDKRTFNKLVEENDILFLIGPRDNGKSYQVKNYVYNDFTKNGNEFIYLRRYPDEAVKTKAGLYFENMDFADKINVGMKIFNYIDSEGHKQRMGHYMDLQHSKKVLKSLSYPKVNTIIFEECLTDGYYLDNETALLENLISTVFRDRDSGKILLIGNLVSPFNPYKEGWSIDTSYIKNKDENSVRRYMINRLNVAVWLVPPNNFKSKMTIGKIGSKLEQAVYEVEEYPLIPTNIEYDVLYTFYVEYQAVTFKCDFVRLKNNIDAYCIFVDYNNYDEVTMQTETPSSDKRIITNTFAFNVKTTNKFTPLSNSEAIVFNYIKLGKVCYTSNDIGTFFNQAIKNLI